MKIRFSESAIISKNSKFIFRFQKLDLQESIRSKFHASSKTGPKDNLGVNFTPPHVIKEITYWLHITLGEKFGN